VRREVPAALAAILTLQAFSVVLTAHNSAFQDEALYLYAGRQIVEGWFGVPLVKVPWASTMSGLGYIYPVIAGIIDLVLGLAGARLLSLAWMLVATVAVYVIAQTVYDRESAPFAAAVFAVQGPVLFLSGLATYDAMTVGLLALAAILALRPRARLVGLPVLVGPLLSLAFLTKYAGILFVPSVLALLAWHTWRTRGFWWASLSTTVATGTFAACSAAVVLALPDARSSLLGSTVNRVVGTTVSRWGLIDLVISAGGPLILGVLIGAILRGRTSWEVSLLLLGSVLLAPAYHIYKEEPISLYKHLAYGFLFGAPAVGFALVRLSMLARRLLTIPFGDGQWVVGIVVCLLFFSMGSQQAVAQFTSWPDSSDLVQLLRTQMQPRTRVLAEEAEVPRYYMQDIAEVWQWNHLNWFEYTDHTGQLLSEDQAYQTAVEEGYFDIVVLRFGYSLDRAHKIEAALQQSPRYRVLAKVPFTTSLGTGQYVVWVRADDQNSSATTSPGLTE
jgi:4-amino-4-deoxy-L-arabinose transferase-like glycosyltransferase